MPVNIKPLFDKIMDDPDIIPEEGQEKKDLAMSMVLQRATQSINNEKALSMANSYNSVSKLLDFLTFQKADPVQGGRITEDGIKIFRDQGLNDKEIIEAMEAMSDVKHVHLDGEDYNPIPEGERVKLSAADAKEWGDKLKAVTESLPISHPMHGRRPKGTGTVTTARSIAANETEISRFQSSFKGASSDDMQRAYKEASDSVRQNPTDSAAHQSGLLVLQAIKNHTEDKGYELKPIEGVPLPLHTTAKQQEMRRTDARAASKQAKQEQKDQPKVEGTSETPAAEDASIKWANGKYNHDLKNGQLIRDNDDKLYKVDRLSGYNVELMGINEDGSWRSAGHRTINTDPSSPEFDKNTSYFPHKIGEGDTAIDNHSDLVEAKAGTQQRMETDTPSKPTPTKTPAKKVTRTKATKPTPTASTDDTGDDEIDPADVDEPTVDEADEAVVPGSQAEFNRQAAAQERAQGKKPDEPMMKVGERVRNPVNGRMGVIQHAYKDGEIDEHGYLVRHNDGSGFTASIGIKDKQEFSNQNSVSISASDWEESVKEHNVLASDAGAEPYDGKPVEATAPEEAPAAEEPAADKPTPKPEAPATDEAAPLPKVGDTSNVRDNPGEIVHTATGKNDHYVLHKQRNGGGSFSLVNPETGDIIEGTEKYFSPEDGGFEVASVGYNSLLRKDKLKEYVPEAVKEPEDTSGVIKPREFKGVTALKKKKYDAQVENARKEAANAGDTAEEGRTEAARVQAEETEAARVQAEADEKATADAETQRLSDEAQTKVDKYEEKLKTATITPEVKKYLQEDFKSEEYPDGMSEEDIETNLRAGKFHNSVGSKLNETRIRQEFPAPKVEEKPAAEEAQSPSDEGAEQGRMDMGEGDESTETDPVVEEPAVEQAPPRGRGRPRKATPEPKPVDKAPPTTDEVPDPEKQRIMQMARDEGLFEHMSQDNPYKYATPEVAEAAMAKMPTNKLGDALGKVSKTKKAAASTAEAIAENDRKAAAATKAKEMKDTANNAETLDKLAEGIPDDTTRADATDKYREILEHKAKYEDNISPANAKKLTAAADVLKEKHGADYQRAHKQVQQNTDAVNAINGLDVSDEEKATAHTAQQKKHEGVIAQDRKEMGTEDSYNDHVSGESGSAARRNAFDNSEANRRVHVDKDGKVTHSTFTDSRLYEGRKKVKESGETSGATSKLDDHVEGDPTTQTHHGWTQQEGREGHHGEVGQQEIKDFKAAEAAKQQAEDAGDSEEVKKQEAAMKEMDDSSGGALGMMSEAALEQQRIDACRPPGPPQPPGSDNVWNCDSHHWVNPDKLNSLQSGMGEGESHYITPNDFPTMLGTTGSAAADAGHFVTATGAHGVSAHTSGVPGNLSHAQLPGMSLNHALTATNRISSETDSEGNVTTNWGESTTTPDSEGNVTPIRSDEHAVFGDVHGRPSHTGGQKQVGPAVDPWHQEVNALKAAAPDAEAAAKLETATGRFRAIRDAGGKAAKGAVRGGMRALRRFDRAMEGEFGERDADVKESLRMLGRDVKTGVKEVKQAYKESPWGEARARKKEAKSQAKIQNIRARTERAVQAQQTLRRATAPPVKPTEE